MCVVSDEKDDDPPAPTPVDVVVPRAPTEDGKGVRVVRLRQAAIEVGEVRPLAEGQPIHANAEVVKLSPREDVPAWNVEVIVPRRTAPAATAAVSAPDRGLKGPPQIASEQYRRNWLAIFGETAEDEVN